MKIAQMQTEVGSNCAWLAVLDIDHFKQDQRIHYRPHSTAMRYYCIFAQLMERTFRYTDILFRLRR